MSFREQPPYLSLKELGFYYNYILLFYFILSRAEGWGGGLGECEKEAEGVGEWDGSGSHNRERPNVYRLAVLLIMPRWPVK